MLQSNGKVALVIRQSDTSTVSQENMRKLCLVPPFCVLCSTWYICVGGGASSSNEENKWRKKDYRIARATHTHTASSGSRRTPSSGHLKHTHPAGFIFQSYLLVDTGRTFWELIPPSFDLFRHCWGRSKEVRLYYLITSVVIVFVLHVERAAQSRIQFYKKKTFWIMNIQVDFIVLFGFSSMH